MDLINNLICQLKNHQLQRIAFPEGADIRVLKATIRLKNEGIVEPILLGDIDTIYDLSQRENLDISGLEIINPLQSTDLASYIQAFLDIRNNQESPERARELISQTNYFGMMMLYFDKVDGVVSGAVYTSSQTIRPALQIIKTKPSVSRVSGAMLFIKGDIKYLYADIAVNTAPLSAENLAEIAIESAKTAKMFDIDPRVAMLSFSTNGSANSDDSHRMAEAALIAKKLAPEVQIDGEMQFDAAIIEAIGQAKFPGSPVAGWANVFIFPDIQAGNIAYKITQYLAGFKALGPLLQGLNKPVNDLSRGCSCDDIYKVAIITALQAINA